MGLRQTLKGKRVYFDANIFIYLLEGFSNLETSLEDIRESIAHQEADIFTSELTLCEVLVPTFRAEKTKLLQLYRHFIEGSGAFSLLPTSRETYIRASLFRAQFGLKTPDAIHVASALEADCSVFLSNDKDLRLPKGMALVSLNGA
jgi:predicted nucleic acid-binding protein